jgi:transposase
MGNRTQVVENRKRLMVTSRDQVYVGLDVHKRTVHAAIRKNGREVRTWVMPSDGEAILATLKPLRAALKRVVYEAGPTGYGLARALEKAGLPVEVVAPGKTPRPANMGSKSDRLDCRTLAQYAEKHLLSRVALPTEEEEADRQVVRLRDQLMNKQRRVKQQIKSLLLYYGIREPEGLATWSRAGVAALGRLELRAQIRLALDTLLDELHHLRGLLKKVQETLGRLARKARLRTKEQRLRTHPGVGPLTAMKFLLEVYQPERFATTRAVAFYVGLAPRVRQSGETRRGGAIIKAGRGSLRATLVEAAWAWIRYDRQAARTYRRLVRNTGSGRKAIVAMARRMAVNLWCILRQGKAYSVAR